ncbi:coiled-coil domain-containing protein-domain-containing protein [Achaetomium macrosporum]|uniref:Coiled-coil domain-containing protein-domain-containing protein n=1 Tax=Achaetomium macrosporum TaxID=79813 RepID=A0AAN7HC78_9PEZI|nr:coiled-coil domain-containing protein-domain-containing protein [Achaetomium macrosporum]
MTPSFDSPDRPPTTTGSPDSFSRPRPRPARSPGHSAKIRAQNRRRAYLERHPSYFQSSDHELADPLLYDFFIRRFQTPAEREAEGRAKGYARVLEGSLLRGEERLARLRREHQQQQPSTSASTLNAELTPPPKTKEEGRMKWEEFLRDRFIRGEDDDFDYSRVDEDDEYDVLEREEREEAWFESEDPGWATSDDDEGDGKTEKMLQGETGIQDF